MDYDEMSFQQEPIPAECFYTRRAYNSLFGSVKVCMILTLIHLYHAKKGAASQMYWRISRASVGGLTTQTIRTQCISARVLAASDGTIRAVSTKMALYPPSRLTIARKISWTYLQRGSPEYPQTSFVSHARRSSGVVLRTGWSGTSKLCARHASGLNYMQACRGQRVAPGCS
jgi:hypothetical protein